MNKLTLKEPTIIHNFQVVGWHLLKYIKSHDSRYESATRGERWVKGSYKRCEAGIRHLQWMQIRYKAATKGLR